VIIQDDECSKPYNKLLFMVMRLICLRKQMAGGGDKIKTAIISFKTAIISFRTAARPTGCG
jgi:hypothetical protein